MTLLNLVHQRIFTEHLQHIFPINIIVLTQYYQNLFEPHHIYGHI